MGESKKISLTEVSTHEDECVVGTRKGMRSDVDGDILLKNKKAGGKNRVLKEFYQELFGHTLIKKIESIRNLS